jgi:hypothetical protein
MFRVGVVWRSSTACVQLTFISPTPSFQFIPTQYDDEHNTESAWELKKKIIAL